MVILEPNQTWPEDYLMDLGTGLRRPMPVSPTALVGKAINEWYRLYGFKPTHLVIGHEAKVKIFELSPYLAVKDFSGKNQDQFLGLKVIFDYRYGMELLTDCYNL